MKKIALLLTFMIAAAQALAAGTVAQLAGTLSVKRADGSVRILSTKSEVLQGDTLQTEKDSYARIKFTDGGEITLKPNSQMTVQEYKFATAKPAEDGAVFSLLRGGMRAVTGLIGKRGDQDAYSMKTNTATIGIRGTTFDADDCKTTACRKAAGEAHSGEGAAGNEATHEAGVYVSVRDGEVLVTNSAGSMRLAAGQFGFIAAATVKPQVLPGDPGLSSIPTQSLLETITSRGRADPNRCD